MQLNAFVVSLTYQILTSRTHKLQAVANGRELKAAGLRFAEKPTTSPHEAEVHTLAGMQSSGEVQLRSLADAVKHLESELDTLRVVEHGFSRSGVQASRMPLDLATCPSPRPLSSPSISITLYTLSIPPPALLPIYLNRPIGVGLPPSTVQH